MTQLLSGSADVDVDELQKFILALVGAQLMLGREPRPDQFELPGGAAIPDSVIEATFAAAFDRYGRPVPEWFDKLLMATNRPGEFAGIPEYLRVCDGPEFRILHDDPARNLGVARRWFGTLTPVNGRRTLAVAVMRVKPYVKLTSPTPPDRH